ncbi:hypothetical protein L1987_29198 [Smallanthus sonchifolius]|uniref:Uncharacterized protein n=1 Tax=Smallanthus sonchifolius TaxID=185202 RepID=A0ACB9I030_9ASTR|nr:hypothetical protein L1987_29198 [Smallanthus sonchifolius]
MSVTQDIFESIPTAAAQFNVGVPGLRKKATGVRPWLVFDSTGRAQITEAGKNSIMCRTGLPARDLRILDPILSYPSTVLGRERAIVVNLEHIKAIITAQEEVLLNSKDPSVAPFVDQLQNRVLRHHQATSQARTLEQEAHPALDKLTSKISTLNLEHVRQIKSRLVAITGRVHKVRDELEQLLDDDGDMAEMYLTLKLEQHLHNSSSSSSSSFVTKEDDEILNTGIYHRLGLLPEEDEIQQVDSQTKGADSGGTKHLNIVELEMLLEAYFVQIDGTLNKLSTLREYVDDTEDYINIMLDEKQNQLLQMGVMLTAATLVVSSLVVVAGVFGMNVHIDLLKNDTDRDKEVGMRKFLWTVGGGTTGSIFLYVMAIFWCKKKRLLQ